MLPSTNFPVFKEINSTTTLVLLRNPTIDNFQVKNNSTQMQTTDSTASTNREMPATIPSIFEPHGLLIPSVIAYKIFLRNCGKTNYNVINYFQLICKKIFISNCRNPKAKGNQLSYHIRSSPGSYLLCEDGTTNYFFKRIKEFN